MASHASHFGSDVQLLAVQLQLPYVVCDTRSCIQHMVPCGCCWLLGGNLAALVVAEDAPLEQLTRHDGESVHAYMYLHVALEPLAHCSNS
jgi:hypothetical protein